MLAVSPILSSWMRRALPLLALGCLASCRQPDRHTTTAPSSYSLEGTVVSVDQAHNRVSINAQAIPGFMPAMVMSYPLGRPEDAKRLAAGDELTGKLVVSSGRYWVEDVTVRAHPEAKKTESVHSHFPAAGDTVPAFEWINQSGRKRALHDYRGKTLIITFIYTRCPFPDFCPRVTSQFAALDRQLRNNPDLFGRTHLLTLSFDPQHDTPKVLLDYGRAHAGPEGRDFRHWEFAAVPEQELKTVSEFFGFWYEDDSGLITHSLSTAVISGEGQIVSWYHGGDWQASDLLRDIEAAGKAGSSRLQ